MGIQEQIPGANKRLEGHEAFEAIIKDISLVAPLNYRQTMFRKWKQVAETALNMHRGPEHPATVEFKAIEFSGPFPRSPLDPPVTEKDKQLYASGLEKARKILEASRIELKAIKDAQIPPPAPIPGFHIRPMAGIGRHEPAVFPPKLMGNESAPAEGIRIVARAGTNVPVSLDDYLLMTDDPIEQRLVIRLRDTIEAPGSSWEGVRDILGELWWHKREAVQKLLPIILKRPGM